MFSRHSDIFRPFVSPIHGAMDVSAAAPATSKANKLEQTSLLSHFARLKCGESVAPRRAAVAPSPAAAALVPCCSSRADVASGLPCEVLQRVLSWLQGDLASLCAALCVCRAWRLAARGEPALWRVLTVCAGRVWGARERPPLALKLTDARLAYLLSLAGAQLTHLHLHGCALLTDAALMPLSRCPLLRQLSLVGCRQLSHAAVLHALQGRHLDQLLLDGVRLDFRAATGYSLDALDALELEDALFRPGQAAATTVLDALGALATELDVNRVCDNRNEYEAQLCSTLVVAWQAEPSDFSPFLHPGNPSEGDICNSCHLQFCTWCRDQAERMHGVPFRWCGCDDGMLLCSSCLVHRAEILQIMSQGGRLPAPDVHHRAASTECGACQAPWCDECLEFGVRTHGDVWWPPRDVGVVHCSTAAWQRRPRCMRTVCGECARGGAIIACPFCEQQFCKTCAHHYRLMAERTTLDGAAVLCCVGCLDKEEVPEQLAMPCARRLDRPVPM